MVDFVIDIEISLTVEELTNLKELADKTESTVEEVARDCMNAKCIEKLDDLPDDG